MHAFTHTSMHTYILCSYIYTCIHTYMTNTHFIHSYEQKYSQICHYAYIPAYKHTHIRTFMHAYIHTTHKCIPFSIHAKIPTQKQIQYTIYHSNLEQLPSSQYCPTVLFNLNDFIYISSFSVPFFCILLPFFLSI